MLGKLFDKMLQDEGVEEDVQQKPLTVKTRKGDLAFILVFLLALLPRVYVLFLTGIESPGWYDDTFHHWQVAYLSKEVGFHQGFLRLWDLKGMEYFWGLLHPLVLAILFFLTGSVSLLVPRMLSVVLGALVIALIFNLLRRWFNLASALGFAVFASFFPISIYSDTAGLQEPLALTCIILGIYFFARKPLLAGVFLSMTGMVRAEYWLFGLGIFIASLAGRQKSDGKVLFTVGYIVPNFIYMKYLLDYTGNPIYPIYWNFLASVKGEWFAQVELSPLVQRISLISKMVFFAGTAISLYIFVKRPRYYLLFLLGFGNILFLGFMLGFGAYIRGYVPRFWVDRLFSWPYMFIVLMLSVFFLYYLPRKLKINYVSQIFGWILIVSTVLLTQLSWTFINNLRIEAERRLVWEIELASKVSREYQGGKILIPEDRPHLVYFLVKKHGVSGKNMVSQMYDPFFYIEEDPFVNWDKYRYDIISWLEDYDIRLVVVSRDKQTYKHLVEKEPELFNLLEQNSKINIYEVNIE